MVLLLFTELLAHSKCQSPQFFEVDSHLEEEGEDVLFSLFMKASKCTIRVLFVSAFC